MDVVAEVDLPCGAAELYTWVDDLSRYPRWLDIVARADRLHEPDNRGVEPAWAVDLRGRLGPLARSKRLRMVRTELDSPRKVAFDRVELDGRQHSTWRLSAAVTDAPDGSHLQMHLHYGGSLFGPVLERVLRDEIERSKDRLRALVSAS